MKAAASMDTSAMAKPKGVTSGELRTPPALTVTAQAFAAWRKAGALAVKQRAGSKRVRRKCAQRAGGDLYGTARAAPMHSSPTAMMVCQPNCFCSTT